ncbi:MAG: Fic family protein [Parasphingorhabdus sp.]
MPFIHENANWPKLVWESDELSPGLAALRYREGQLVGRMQGLGFDLRQEASLKTLTDDVVKSSAIEGETLNPDEVRSSIARRLGLDVGGLVPSSRDVEGIVEMMLDATQKFADPLTDERLFDWHAALFPTGRSGMQKITVGNWRPKEAGAMQVVSGPYGREKVHFEAPSAERLQAEMGEFLKWFNAPSPIDPVLRAGIAHFWFVTIHPFEDGNGRIARAIADMSLARADGSKDRFYSMSAQIETERKDYYDRLEAQQRDGLDITPWLSWFLGCLGRAFDRAEETLEAVLYKARLWDKANRYLVNERQRLVINRMLEDSWEGNLNTSKYARLAKCSNDTALRDIRGLLESDVLLQNAGGGRSTSYRLAGSAEL